MTGLTLFKGRGGWQLSTRPDGEEGWSVRFISDADALALLARAAEVPSQPASAVRATIKPSLEDLGL